MTEQTDIEFLKAELERLRSIVEKGAVQKQTKLLNRSDVVLFFAEAFQRWGKRSPKYLRVWKGINWIIAALSGVPYILTQLQIVAPPRWATVIMGIVTFSSLYGSAMNTLVVAKPEPEAMPFTEKKQLQQEIKVEEQINAIK